MKSPLTILGVIVSLVLILLAIEVFLLPDARKKKRHKKKKKEKAQEEAVDLAPWKNKTARLEKKIHELVMKNEQLQSREREYQKELALEDVKNKKYQEKIKQEKVWQKREYELADKTNKELARMKADLVKEQETFSKEHQLKIVLERENKSLQKEYKEVLARAKNLDKEITLLQNKNEKQRQEIATLKKDVIELNRKKDDVQWVAKSDFDQLKMQAKALQKELDRLKRDHG